MKLKFTENDKRHPLYNTWWNMIARCYFEASPGFAGYGGRGIDVSEPWHTFKTFADDMGGKKISGLSLDRVNNDAGYSSANCKWSNRSDQMLNRRRFGSNTSGETGVIPIADRFEARFHYEGVRYRIGRFDTPDEAKVARSKFVDLFVTDMAAAIASIAEPTVWCTSGTKVRGVSAHKDGGYIVRASRDGVRHYVGYFRTFDEAVDARREFDKS